MPSLRYRYKSDTLTLSGYAACQEVPSTATCMAMYHTWSMWMDQSTPSHEMPQGRGVVCMHQDRTSVRGIFVSTQSTPCEVQATASGISAIILPVLRTKYYSVLYLYAVLSPPVFLLWTFNFNFLQCSGTGRHAICNRPDSAPLLTAPIHTSTVTAMSLQARVIL
ncbi:hypothetical protein HDV62DRAFT_207247 [Trichoderma sp. SZMC 28011]